MRSVNNILPMPCPAAVPRPSGAMRRGAAAWAGHGTWQALAGLLLVLGAPTAAAAEGAAVAAPAGANAAAAAVPEGDEIAQWMRHTAQTALDSQAGATGQPPRVEVSVGRLDARLKLAPCHKVLPYLPAGSRALGSTRIGLRCTEGAKRWNVYLPVTVKVFARSLVAAAALPAGTVLQRQHLAEAEVDIAASTDPAIGQPNLAVGRTLARHLAAGDALHQADLKPRLWFAAGDTVRVVAMGPGFQIAADAQALGPGHDGQTVRARIEGGRIVAGVATAERRIEVPM